MAVSLWPVRVECCHLECMCQFLGLKKISKYGQVVAYTEIPNPQTRWKLVFMVACGISINWKISRSNFYMQAYLPKQRLPQKNGHIFREEQLLGLVSFMSPPSFDPSPLRKSPEPLNRILVEEHVIRSYSIYVYKNMYVQMNGQTFYKTPHGYPVSFGFLPLPCGNLF